MTLKKCTYGVGRNSIVINAEFVLATISVKNLASVIISYEIYADGKISVCVICNKSKK